MISLHTVPSTGPGTPRPQGVVFALFRAPVGTPDGCEVCLTSSPHTGASAWGSSSFDRKKAVGPQFCYMFLYSGLQLPHFLCFETILQDKCKP